MCGRPDRLQKETGIDEYQYKRDRKRKNQQNLAAVRHHFFALPEQAQNRLAVNADKGKNNRKKNQIALAFVIDFAAGGKFVGAEFLRRFDQHALQQPDGNSEQQRKNGVGQADVGQLFRIVVSDNNRVDNPHQSHCHK